MWEGTRIILSDISLDREEARKVLPRGMWLTDPPTATVYISHCKKTSFTVPYKEAGMMIHVRTVFGKGWHCCWLLVDDDMALIYGRELLGYQKKMGTFSFDESESGIRASVERRGVTVVSIEGKKGARQENPEPITGRRTYNIGGAGQLLILNPIWMFKSREEIRESYSADVSVSIEESEDDPIARLVTGETSNGRIAVNNTRGLKYCLPIGIAGPLWTDKTLDIRY